ncbi:ABC-three component system protein [Methanococcoides sp. AM1]|uniref:ABC-three component system protein n=1 Tax=Methanococcoides sp. AM1 TaxID=1201011 RepID=UPI0010835012|nr:ABC-three component system protein [Methanococcoides sp. AM1]
MGSKIKHSAAPSIEGTIYQFYIAIDKCFELLEGEKIFIETYGDVTVSGMCQIEVKHYTEDLTDLHENVWKTINNWLQDNFDTGFYKNLILLTTQRFGSKSSFKGWNNRLKSEKKQILDDIALKYQQRNNRSQSTEKLLDSVLDDTKKDKLLDILDKFIIFDSSAESTTYYEMIKQKHGKAVLSSNADDYINSLMGYLLSPEVRIGDGWEITYQGFTSKVRALVNQFRSGTTIFPKPSLNIDNDKIDSHNEHLFVKKIEDIDYHEIKGKAISDYVRTNYTISQEFKKYAVEKKHYNDYEQEILDTYNPAYSKASRNTNETDRTSDSKDFYDTITASEAPQFIHFNDTPKFFKNGILHGLANDEDKNVVWKLKVDKDE